MNPRHLAAAVAATVLLALVGLVVLAGGGAVATGLSAGRTPPEAAPRRQTRPQPRPTAGLPGPARTPRPPPSGPSGPRAVFAAAYLTRLAAPTSPANLAFLTAWMTAESGPDTGNPTLSAAATTRSTPP